MGNGDESREDGERKGDKDGDLMLLGDVLWRFMTKWRWRTPNDKWMTPSSWFQLLVQSWTSPLAGAPPPARFEPPTSLSNCDPSSIHTLPPS